MNNLPVFVSLSLLYFAAVSYAEAARRLGRPHLAPSFLLRSDPVFGPACVRLFDRARRPLTEEESQILSSQILKAIEPFNVAGLGNPAAGTGTPSIPTICFAPPEARRYFRARLWNCSGAAAFSFFSRNSTARSPGLAENYRENTKIEIEGQMPGPADCDPGIRRHNESATTPMESMTDSLSPLFSMNAC